MPSKKARAKTKAAAEAPHVNHALITAEVVDGKLQVTADGLEVAKVDSHVDKDGAHVITGLTFKPAVGPDGRRYVTLDTGERRAVDEFWCAACVAPRPHPDAWVEHINGDLADDSVGNLRWMTAELASWTVPEGHFVVQDKMTVLDIHKIALESSKHREKGVAELVIPRKDTAVESIQDFIAHLDMMETPGNTINGRPSPINFPGTLIMKNVSVVIVNTRGEDVLAPPGYPHKYPTLYAPVGGTHVYAAYGDNLVAILHEPRVGGEASIFWAE